MTGRGADTQLPLALPVRRARGRADFMVAEPNRHAAEMIDRWPDWPAHGLMLTGPRAAGKSHLAGVWCARTGADSWALHDLAERIEDMPGPDRVLIEDVDRLVALPGAERAAAEAALCLLYNRLRDRGGALLLTALLPPAAWQIDLPDLASRLRSLPVARLDPPDDALLAAVLVKHFADRQLRVDPDVVTYLGRRIDRSFEAAERAVRVLDEAALSRRRRINRSLAAELLPRIAGSPGAADRARD